MLSLIKKLFGKPKPQAVKVYATPKAVAAEPPSTIPSVEVAHLSLSAIVNNLPDDIKALVRQQPSETATVALPVPTIMKQLPTGSVKISLASLHRQAHGVFAPLAVGDKRTVDVPLAEIFRHVSPRSLRRRPDQRAVNLPTNGFNLFGNASNPYEIAPSVPEEEEQVDAAELEPEPEPPRAQAVQPRVRATPAGAPRATPVAAPKATPAATPKATAPTAGGARQPRGVAAPVAHKAAEPAPEESGPPLVLSLESVSGTWPDEISNLLAEAISAGATLEVPSNLLSDGLAKGRAVFTWGQICSWIRPGPISTGIFDPGAPLGLPLKVVAPAFMALQHLKFPKRSVELDESIPALFTNNSPPKRSMPPPAAPAPIAPPKLEVLAAPKLEPAAPAEVAEPTVEEHAVAEAQPSFEAPPVVESKPLRFQPSEPLAAPSHETPPAAEAQPIEPVARQDEPLHFPSPEAGTPAPLEAEPSSDYPETVGAVFGEPNKKDWTPAEIVHRTVHLPGVSGAIVALQEGLQVASSLPDGVKSDVIAAFLPQIFARLNQYAGEMKLGDVDDLLFTTHGAHCQIYRLGFVYFAVLGKPGESLPWHELRIVSEELARQTHK